MSSSGIPGPLAVVTGASSGLGAIFAQRLGERGFNLLLTGRRPDRLEQVRHRVIAGARDCAVTLVTADLATGDGVLALLHELGDRPVDLLVNNAGFGTYGPFDRSDTAREIDVIGVDVAALVRLTRAVLPGMIERRRGGVLNVASTIAFQPAPYQATYGAAKAFVLSFSQALWQETRHRGVTVTALCPSPTKTGFLDALQNAEAAQTAIYARLAEPGPVVDAGLRALDRGIPIAVPGLRNQAIAFLPRITPRRLITSMSGRYLTPRLPSSVLQKRGFPERHKTGDYKDQ
jgi:short-subunit dehydrogenase